MTARRVRVFCTRRDGGGHARLLMVRGGVLAVPLVSGASREKRARAHLRKMRSGRWCSAAVR